MINPDDRVVSTEDVADLQSVVNDLVGNMRRGTINNLLNGYDTDFLEAFDNSFLAQNIFDDMRGDSIGAATSSIDGDDDKWVSVTIQEQIEAVKKTIQVTGCQDSINLSLIHHLRNFLRGLTHHKLSGMRQSTIKDFFKR